jgi:3-methyladenine DNA glycosylase AlkD
VLENVAMSFLLVPLEFHVFSIYRNSALSNEFRVVKSVGEFLRERAKFRENLGVAHKCENPR